MPIRTLPSRAIADASIQAVDIASNSISKAKIDADTRLGLQNDSIILDGTDGAGANKGDFLVLDGTDNSSTNADDRILFDEIFIDKIGLFNINTLGSGGQAVKVNTGGTGLEFGAAGGLVLLEEKNVVSGSAATQPFHFQNIFSSTYRTYKAIYSVKETESSNNASNSGLIVRLGNAGTLSTGTSSTVSHSLQYLRGDNTTHSVVYGDSDDILVFCQNSASNEDMLAMGSCEFHNFQTADLPAFCLSNTVMHGTSNTNYLDTGFNILQNNNNFTDVSFEYKVTGGGGGGNMDYTTTGYNVFGNVKIYGII